MGMQIFLQSRFPEQYPAIIDERADPVEGDTAEMALLRPFLKNTNLETGLRLMYHANKDGWDPVKFHANVRVEELFMSLLGKVFNLVDTILKMGGVWRSTWFYCCFSVCSGREDILLHLHLHLRRRALHLLSITGEKILQLVQNLDFSLVQM
jgi:hypothetical protein